MAFTLGPIDAIPVAELLGQAVDLDVPMIPGAVNQGIEWDLGLNRPAAWLREYQAYGRAMTTNEGEVDPAMREAGTERQRIAA